MSKIYDDWERLVDATLKREQLWQLCHAPSISSIASSEFSFPSPVPDFPHDSSAYGSCYEVETGSIKNFSEVLEPEEEIWVNGKAIDNSELSILLSCPNPPKKLKPGNYWYDKHVGFWGKQGHKPSQVISANLDVGGPLHRYASNGNTSVYINGREITKVELRFLKFIGVQCYRHTDFRIHGNGSSTEGGIMRFKRGNIWGKAWMMLLSSLLSLPFPSKFSYASGIRMWALCAADSTIFQLKKFSKKKLLVIGRTGSGKSTFFKQAKFLYKDEPFLKDELNHIKFLIRNNIYRCIRTLLEARQHFEEEYLNESRVIQSCDEGGLTGYTDPDEGNNTYSIGPRLKAFSDWLLHNLASGSLDLSSSSVIQKYGQLLNELWIHPAIQGTLERASESGKLPCSTEYFLKRAGEIFKPNYRPSRMDILYAEYLPSSPLHLEFSFPRPEDNVHSMDQQNFMERYLLIRSPTDCFVDNDQQLEMFEDAKIVIFCVSLNDYDKFLVNGDGAYVNKMIFDKKFFEQFVTHPSFEQTCSLLVLTKCDLFEEKIKQSPLDQCDWFREFHPVPHTAGGVVGDLGEMVFHYISVQFKRLYAAATGRKLFVTKVNSLDQHSVAATLKYAHEILKWNEEIPYYSNSKENSYFEEHNRRKFLICG